MRAAALAIDGEALGADMPRLLTHFDFPAAHSKYIPSTKLIEFTFATVTPRRRATKGAGSRVTGLRRPSSYCMPHRDAGAGWMRTTSARLSKRAEVVHTWTQDGTDRAAHRMESGNGRRLITFNPQLLTYLEELELGNMS